VNASPIVTISGWVKVYRTRRMQPLHPFAFTLLTVVSMLAAVPACAFIYFNWNYVYRPPWEDPIVLLHGWFCLLGPFSMVLGFLAFRNEPKWLFWVLEPVSIWLTALGVMAVIAY
jgi:hypothetical protein